jgi:hypothetical protein
MSWSPDERWQIGSVCTHSSSGNWYVVRRMGKRGACFGPCFYGPDVGPIEKRGLRAYCELVEPDHIPDAVVAALAALALTGRFNGSHQ